MSRPEKNKAWIESLKEKGISTIELDLVNNKVKLKIHNLALYTKFREQIENICSGYASMSNHSFDFRLNINLIGLLVQEISELEIPSDIKRFNNPLRAIRFEDNTAVVDLHAGIIDVEITDIQGETMDDGDTYWIKNP